jgi:hypothetical protein
MPTVVRRIRRYVLDVIQFRAGHLAVAQDDFPVNKTRCWDAAQVEDDLEQVVGIISVLTPA